MHRPREERQMEEEVECKRIWWKQRKQTVMRRTVTADQCERIGGRLVSLMKDKR